MPAVHSRRVGKERPSNALHDPLRCVHKRNKSTRCWQHKVPSLRWTSCLQAASVNHARKADIAGEGLGEYRFVRDVSYRFISK